MSDEGISTTATASVGVIPDLTVVRFGTEVVAPTLGGAMAANAERATALLNAVKATGVDDRQIRTEHVGVNPWHGPPFGNDGSPTGPTAFVAATNLTVQVATGQQVNGLLDAAVGAAGESFRLFGVSFVVSDPAAARADARRAATEVALAQARQLADAAGVELGALLQLDELDGGGGYPGGGFRVLPAASAPFSPVEAGSEQVSVTVRARFAIAG